MPSKPLKSVKTVQISAKNILACAEPSKSGVRFGCAQLIIKKLGIPLLIHIIIGLCRPAGSGTQHKFVTEITLGFVFHRLGGPAGTLINGMVKQRAI